MSNPIKCRYDVRATLCNLAPHETPAGGYGNRLDYLSAEEQRAEQLCEEERYLFLYNNEEEHILQQEEELKRQTQNIGCTYSQVGFQYDSNGMANNVQIGPNCEQDNDSPTCEEAEQPFCMPRNFEVPASMQVPDTMKQHAIIERTARFIASQGIQMEILLKAKQCNNVRFEFLTQNSLLNPYYKYLINAMKNGNYPMESDEMQQQHEQQQANSTNALDNNAVFGVELDKPIITVPTIKYKPSPNCSYTQLISKIKGVPMPIVLDESNNVTQQNNCASPSTPVLLQLNGNTFVSATEIAEDSNSNSNNAQPNKTAADASKVEIIKNSSALALAQNYSSDSETDEEEQQKLAEIKPEPILNFPVPTDNLKNIIDKTATYVIKNGRQFEETLRTKSEERFTFLLPDNEHYAYYMYKITGDPDAASKEQKQRKAAAVAAAVLSKKGLLPEKNNAPVSFCIKSQESVTAGLQPALPQEPSDDEEDSAANSTLKTTQNATTARQVPESVQKAIQLVESQLMARNAQLAAVTGAASMINAAVAAATNNHNVRSRFDVNYVPNNVVSSKTARAEMKRNALFEQQQQNRQKELKKAEEKVKDKLAQIAREKLGLISKEKQLQLERKQKVRAFIHQIKGDESINDNDTQNADNNHNNASDDSDTSVQSIPITSYGPEEGDTDKEEEQQSNNFIKLQMPAAPAPPIISQHDREADELDDAQSQMSKTTTVLLSDDDDDVELISETKAPPLRRTHKRHTSRSHYAEETFKRARRHSTESMSSTCSDSSDSSIEQKQRMRAQAHYSKHRANKSSKSKKSKKKSKKKTRSRSGSVEYRSKNHRRHRCESFYHSDSASEESAYERSSSRYRKSTSRSHAMHKSQRRSVSTTPTRRKHKKR